MLSGCFRLDVGGDYVEDPTVRGPKQISGEELVARVRAAMTELRRLDQRAEQYPVWERRQPTSGRAEAAVWRWLRAAA